MKRLPSGSRLYFRRSFRGAVSLGMDQFEQRGDHPEITAKGGEFNGVYVVFSVADRKEVNKRIANPKLICLKYLHR
jgi:hypothetical protein